MRAAVRSARLVQRATAMLAIPALLATGLVGSRPAEAGPVSAPHDGPGTDAKSGSAPHPVQPSVRSYAVIGVAKDGLRTLRDFKSAHSDHLAALSVPRPARGFAVTGVTWAGAAPEGLGLAIRSRTDGRWSGWTLMPYDAEHGPDPASSEGRRARPGTDPFVVGAVDDVQLKVTSDSGRAPRDLTLDVVDPGTSSADASPALSSPAAEEHGMSPGRAAGVAAPPGVTAETSAVGSNLPVSAPGATPMPTIHSRSDWGADERLRGCCVEYGEVHAGFVHHTVNANGYSRREVPAILRGIYAYHTQSRGWRDIGYNFLIDRFGRIWEGRYGGVTLPVVGAHTLDYNENSFAASAIGNYDVARPSTAMIKAYARLYAWKLSLHGVRPTTRQSVAGTTFDAISGHRDAAQTACPGRYLYAKIPQIIHRASEIQRSYGGRDLQHSFMRDRTPDVLLVGARGAVSVARGTSGPGIAAPVAATSPGFSAADLVAPVRDVTGDGRPDLLVRDASTRRTSVYPGLRNGGFGAASHSVGTWASADLFAGVGDVTGDDLADVVARNGSTGVLRVYPGRGNGTFGRSRVAIADARGMDLVTGAGDFDRDGHGDLLTRGTHGALVVRFGAGDASFPRSVRIAHDWSGRDVVTGGVDLTGDGLPDLVARSAKTHTTATYANVDGSHLSPAIAHRTIAGTVVGLSPDLSRDGKPDIVGLTRTGEVRTYSVARTNWLMPPRARSYSWRGTDKALVVGDWDGDGFVDAMGRRAADGTMSLYRGNRRGGFEAPVGRWPGWGDRRQITAVGDVNGDGFPDLMAQTRKRTVYLYPGRRLHGFKAPIRMRTSLPAGSTILGVGLWDRDGAPDVLVRDGNGRIVLYPGNGPGGLDDPRVIGSGYRGYRTLVGVGDLTGDGQPDLLGRLANGQTWLIPGRAPSPKARGGGFGPRRFLAADWDGILLG